MRKHGGSRYLIFDAEIKAKLTSEEVEPPSNLLDSEPSIVSETKTVGLGDLLPRLRAEFQKGTEEDFIHLCIRLGCTNEDAKSLFERLVNQTGEIATDKDGFWTWVR